MNLRRKRESFFKREIIIFLLPSIALLCVLAWAGCSVILKILKVMIDTLSINTLRLWVGSLMSRSSGSYKQPGHSENGANYFLRCDRKTVSIGEPEPAEARCAAVPSVLGGGSAWSKPSVSENQRPGGRRPRHRRSEVRSRYEPLDPISLRSVGPPRCSWKSRR